jgi:lipid-binding SYLF domain-containing protein
VKLQTEIYSYSRSRGLFAGLSLEGSSLATDDNANSTVYGGDPEPEDLLFSVGDIPSGVAPFIESLARNAPGEP